MTVVARQRALTRTDRTVARPRPGSSLLAALPAIVGLAGVTLAVMAAGAAPVHAACPVLTYAFDPSGSGRLTPQQVTVDPGGCVSLNNQTFTSATFTVGSGYRQTVRQFDSTDYVATVAGTTLAVTAQGSAGEETGSIVVRPASPAPRPTGSRSPAPRPSPPAPPPSSPAGPVGPSPAPTSSSGPAAGPTRSAVASHRPAATGPPTGAASPPSAYLTGRPPLPSPSTSSAVVSAPLQPVSGRGVGLPAAVAALAVVGTAGGLLRVLVAEPAPTGPVDGGPGRAGRP